MTTRYGRAKEEAVRHVDELVVELFGGGRRQTHRYEGRWAVANKWRPKAKIGQMAVWRDGGRRGAFRDYAGTAHGDALDLVAYGLKGIVDNDSRRAAVEWLEDRYGLRDLTPERRRELDEAAERNRLQREAEAAEHQSGNRTQARKAFYACEEEIAGTAVEAYLARSRGVRLEDVPNVSAAIRYRRQAQYWMRPDRPLFEAMVCCMVDIDGHIGANHFTFLEPGGSGKLDTAGRGWLDDDGDPLSAKLMWPSTRGLTIPLTYGPSGVKHYRAEPRSDLMGFTEGTEDGLTSALVDESLRMHAVGSLAGLGSVPDFPCAAGYLVFRDNDWSKPQAVAQFDRHIARLRSFGKPVEIAAVPEDWGKDVNETLNG